MTVDQPDGRPSPALMAGLRKPEAQVAQVAQMSTTTDLEPATVEWWNVDRGFGVVRLSASGGTAFVRNAVLPGTGFRCLVSGEPVLVRVEPSTYDGRPAVSSLSFLPSRRRGVVVDFDHLKGYGHIREHGTEQSLFVHYAAILAPEGSRATLAEGEEVSFDITSAEKGPTATLVKRLDPRDSLSQFVRVPSQMWQTLADLAEQQDVWVLNAPDDDEPGRDDDVSEQPGSGAPATADLPVLRSYVHHTFARLADEKKVAYGGPENDRRAAFNTGLVTPNQEEIYGVLAAKVPDDGYPWRLLGWMKESDGRVAGIFSPRPERATYWNDPAVLFYDTRLPLILDWDHFVKDNLSRYPDDLQNEAMALMLTKSAVGRAVERVGRNYKAAIPQFHRGEVQLLLPLALRGTAEAQLALVVRRVGNEYHGETVLPLAAALKNARLLARPDRDWLNP